MAFDLDDETEYYNCPEKFIPDNIYTWYEQYIYEEKNGTNEPYSQYIKRSNRFIEAKNCFVHWLNHWSDLKTPKKQDGIQRIKQSWQKP